MLHPGPRPSSRATGGGVLTRRPFAAPPLTVRFMGTTRAAAQMVQTVLDSTAPVCSTTARRCAARASLTHYSRAGGGRSFSATPRATTWALGLALGCLFTADAAGNPLAVNSIPNGRIFSLPSNGTLEAHGAQTCEAARDTLGGDIGAFLTGFDLVVVTFALWYHDELSMRSCLDELLPILARINSAGNGAAAILLEPWPSHFASTQDGAWIQGAGRSCSGLAALDAATHGNVGCINPGSLEELAAAGLSSRARGPQGLLVGCAPSPNDVMSGWTSIFHERVAAYPHVPLIDFTSVVGPLYGAHLRNYEVLDCAHTCYDANIFGALWDAVIRSAIIVASSNGAAEGASGASGQGKSLQHARLDFEALCPRRDVLISALGTPLHAPPSPEANLRVVVVDGVAELYRAIRGNAVYVGNVRIALSVGAGLAGSPPLPPRVGFTVLAFFDVSYGDLSYRVTENATRIGHEVAFAKHAHAIDAKGWAVNLNSSHFDWVRSTYRQGDAVALRIVVCEQDTADGVRGSGEVRLCRVGGAVGCAVESIIVRSASAKL